MVGKLKAANLYFICKSWLYQNIFHSSVDSNTATQFIIIMKRLEHKPDEQLQKKEVNCQRT